jgi:hypothetical protein
MNTMKKTAAGAVLGGSLLAAGGFGLAHAAPPAESVVNDGRVNVTVMAGGQQIGVLQDVSLTSAQAFAASACANAGITAESLQALDVSGTPLPNTCESGNAGLTFTFAQNSPVQSENAPGLNAPGQNSPTPATPAPATTTAAQTTAR